MDDMSIEELLACMGTERQTDAIKELKERERERKDLKRNAQRKRYVYQIEHSCVKEFLRLRHHYTRDIL